MVLTETISCEWDGHEAQYSTKVLSGPAESKFGMGTITLRQPFIWRTPPDRALLLGPQPNAPISLWRMMDAWIDSSRLTYPWFPTLRLLHPGMHEIPRGTVIGSIREVVAHNGPPTTAGTELPAQAQNRHQRMADWRASGRDGLWRASSRRFDAVQRNGDVFTGRGWLGEDACCDLLNAFDPRDTSWRPDVGIWRFDLAEWPELNEALDDIGELLARATAIPLIMLNPHGVRWESGASMPAHIDIGGELEFPERRWSSVIYLNSVESGGRTLIPTFGARIEPAPGAMAAWPGGVVAHAVEAANEPRHTVICWWAADQEYAR